MCTTMVIGKRIRGRIRSWNGTFSKITWRTRAYVKLLCNKSAELQICSSLLSTNLFDSTVLWFSNHVGITAPNISFCRKGLQPLIGRSVSSGTQKWSNGTQDLFLWARPFAIYLQEDFLRAAASLLSYMFFGCFVYTTHHLEDDTESACSDSARS